LSSHRREKLEDWHLQSPGRTRSANPCPPQLHLPAQNQLAASEKAFSAVRPLLAIAQPASMSRVPLRWMAAAPTSECRGERDGSAVWESERDLSA